MGCTSSDPISPITFTTKSPAVDCLSDGMKQKIKKCIDSDSLLELAVLLNTKDNSNEILLNAEISDTGLKWMMTHYCCLVDASTCLQFLLKNYFVEKGPLYLDYINAPTAQGLTCLHQCAMWRAEKCFSVLHFYGGLNLNCYDKNRKTPLDLAYQYRVKGMSEILRGYKEIGVFFTVVEAERLTSGKILDQGGKQKDQSNKQRQAGIQGQGQNQETEQEKKLKQAQKKLEADADLILKNKMNKQAELKAQKQELAKNKEMKQAQRQKIQKQMQARHDQLLKQQRQKYKLQLQLKQQQLINIKQELKKAQQQRAEQQKLRVQKQTENYVQQKAQTMKELIKNKNQMIVKLSQKENRQDGGGARGDIAGETVAKKPLKPKEPVKNVRSALKDSFDAVQEKVPPEIQKLYNEAVAKGSFTDKEFPAEMRSIGDPSNQNFANFQSKIIWLRPSQIFPQGEQYQLFNQIDPSDVQQGQLGVCYMLATISSLAVNQGHIEKLFVFSDIGLGFYVIRLYQHGKPRFFVIDDLIPCSNETNFPVFTQPVGNQLWVMLLEKVWAKAIGSYLSAEGMVPDEMMQDFSGAPGFGQYFQDPNLQQGDTPIPLTQHFQTLVTHSQAGSTIVISSKEGDQQGIVGGHAYGLLEVFQYKGKNIFKMRNPWGNTELEGEYSSKSRALTAEVKKLIGFTDEDDGVFYLSETQLVKYFSYYSISVLSDTHKYSHLQFTSKASQSKYFHFKLSSPGYTNIRIIQKFNRMLNDPEYQYSPATLEIGKIQDADTCTFLGEGDKDTYWGAKSVHGIEGIGEELEPGEYFVHIKMLWNNEKKYNSAVLAVYCPEHVKIEELDAKKGLAHLKNLYYSHASEIEPTATEDNNGTFRIDTMKSQFVYIAQTQDPSSTYTAEFEFLPQQMSGVKTDIGRVSENKLAVEVRGGRPGIGTVAIVKPADGGDCGETYVTFLQK